MHPRSYSLFLFLVLITFVAPAATFLLSTAPDSLTCCANSKNFQRQQINTFASISSDSSSMSEIKVVSQPDEATLTRMGVNSWPTWGCDVSKFPWSYGDAETCYILQGRVTVTPTSGGKAVTVGKGDLVTFPEGMSCVWDVTEAINKRYTFH
ncbi:enzyme of the cupin superfamily [Nannochloropsis oceanica]